WSSDVCSSDLVFGSSGFIRVVPSEVSEFPSMVVSVEGILKLEPSFFVHCPLNVDDWLPEPLPFICGRPTLTEYVPSELILMPTLADSPLASPDDSVVDVEVPRISCHVLPRSQEFFSTASTRSFDDIRWLIVAIPLLEPFFSGASTTATRALYV